MSARALARAMILLALTGSVPSTLYAQQMYRLKVGMAENIVVRGGAEGKPQTIDCGGWAGSKTCVASYPAGTTVKLTAGATTTGMAWNNWTDACQTFGSEPRCTIVMTRNMEVWGTARNVGSTTFRVGAPSNGYIYGTSPGTGDRWIINCGNNGPCEATLTNGEKLALKVIPHSGYAPNVWMGACISAHGDACTVVANGGIVGLGHDFKVATHTLALQVGEHVTATLERQPPGQPPCHGPKNCKVQVVGYSVHVRMTPDEGYVLANKGGCSMIVGGDAQDICVVSIWGETSAMLVTAKKR